MNNKEYWQKREEEKLNKGIKDCNKLAKELQSHYKLAHKEIEKEIQKSDIGINPNNDGKVIRLVFPELTEERRKELVKQVKAISEEGKVAIRNIRREAMDDIEKLELSEDEEKGIEKEKWHEIVSES